MPAPAIVLFLIILFVASLRFLQSFYYNIALTGYHICIHIASLFNKKAKLWVTGRKKLFEGLQHNFNYPHSKKIWVHCASLGEFEQGRTVMEKIKTEFPDHKILLTFYSPSGYQVRKDYMYADYVTYMPFDTKKNAKKFLSITRPDIALFIKYEFWLHHIAELHKKKIPLFLVSGIFRKKQLFFKWYGILFRRSLKKFTTLFVQDTGSLELLNKYKITNTEMAYDTRFDRVKEIVSRSKDVPWLADFTKDHNVLIAGSTWPKDEKILSKAFYHSLVYLNFKLVLAPHNISKKHLSKTFKLFKKYSLKYSELGTATPEDIKGKRVLIIDNIGMLSSAYKFADVCYIGGGFDKGIHNTLEAAVYGKPLIFGPRYKKFNEAVDLIKNGAAFVIYGDDDLLQRINFMNQFGFVFKGAGSDAKQYVESHTGGTEKMMDTLRVYLQ